MRRRSTRHGWIGKRRIGVTAGASAPEVLVQAVIDRLKDAWAQRACARSKAWRRHVTFPLPKGLGGGTAAGQLNNRCISHEAAAQAAA